jgi:hypothetical protein
MGTLSISCGLSLRFASRVPLGLIAPIWRKLLDPYRPELYYMRGPGPKWREKHRSSTMTYLPPAQRGTV